MSDYEYYDTKTNLEWKAGPDIDTTWAEANMWVISQGDGWRMPSRDELFSLYQKDLGGRNMPPELKTTGWWLWANDTACPLSAWIFYFGAGHDDRLNQFRSDSGRVFAVRSRKS